MKLSRRHSLQIIILMKSRSQQHARGGYTHAARTQKGKRVTSAVTYSPMRSSLARERGSEPATQPPPHRHNASASTLYRERNPQASITIVGVIDEGAELFLNCKSKNFTFFDYYTMFPHRKLKVSDEKNRNFCV